VSPKRSTAGRAVGRPVGHDVFNCEDDDVAWVRAEPGIDLQAIVDEALAREPED
jgi:hypothetical protein